MPIGGGLAEERKSQWAYWCGMVGLTVIATVLFLLLPSPAELEAQEKEQPELTGDRITEDCVVPRISDLDSGRLCQIHEWRIDEVGWRHQLFVDKQHCLYVRLDTDVSQYESVSGEKSIPVWIDTDRTYVKIKYSDIEGRSFYTRDVPESERIPVKIDFSKK